MAQDKHTALPLWSIILPVLGWLAFFIGVKNGVFLPILASLLLIGSVLSAVHHAEVLALRVGEPFGTIILALAITVLEVGLIVSMMIAGGESANVLARDTVFAAIMLILNGLLGLSLLSGGLLHHEQFFGKKSAITALVTLVSILTLTLILPNVTTSSPEGTYTSSQLVFVAIAGVILYSAFILTQTVRHRDYFLSEDNSVAHAEPPTRKVAMISLAMLIICLGVVIALAKSLSPSIENLVNLMGAPKALVGVIIAIVVLLPECIAALTAAYRNRIQTSINLALGSALASIGLTIPAVAIVCLLLGIDLVLGLDSKSITLMILSLFSVVLSLMHGKTNMLYGVVLIVNLATYIFTVIVP